MIDLHTHVLAGVDDGAATVEESCKMLAMAAEDSTQAIVATPHCDLRYKYEPARCRDLAHQLREAMTSGPKLYTGCELHLTPENIEALLCRPCDYTLNRSDCVLIELPDQIAPAAVCDTVDRITNYGLRPILAHPERNGTIQRNLDLAERVVEAGCYLQLTAQAIAGSFGAPAERAASYLLKHRLAHFIASDAHGSEHRRPLLSIAFTEVSRRYGQAAAKLLFWSNPRAALHGATIQPMPELRRFGWNTLLTRTHANSTTPDSNICDLPPVQ
jgi:protein-tyrosine phosphatase